MKRVFACVLLLGCAGSRPPPQSCEVPPPSKKVVEVGTCSADAPAFTPADGGIVRDAAPDGDSE